MIESLMAESGNGKGENTIRAAKRKAPTARGRWTKVAGVFIIGVALFSLTRTRTKPAETLHATERLRYAMRDAVEITEPSIVRTTENALWLTQVCEGLVRFADGSVDVEPCLAEKYEMREGGKEWVFSLRRNVLFHDGTPLNADAVRFNVMRQIDPSHPYHRAGALAAARNLYGSPESGDSWFLSDIRTSDPLTVTFVLSRPYAGFLRNLACVEAALVSPHSVQAAAADGNTTVVGTGPMRVGAFIEGGKVVLERNDLYWGPPARCRQMEFRSIPAAKERERALREGLCELGQRFSPDTLAGLAQAKNLRVISGPGTHTCAIFLNPRIAPLDQATIRTALSCALDRKMACDNLLKGYGSPATSFYPPGIKDVLSSAILSERKETQHALELLEQAGFRDGFSLKVLIPDEERVWNPAGEKIGEWLVQSFEEIRVKAIIERVGVRELPGRIRKGDFQAAVWGITCYNGDPDAYLRDALGTAAPVLESVFSTEFQELNQLIAEASLQWNKQLRAKNYGAIESQLATKSYWIPLFHASQVMVAQKTLSGITPHPLGLTRLSWISEGKNK